MTRLERDVDEVALMLEAVGRITNAWVTAQEMLAAETMPPKPDEPEPPETDAEWVPMVEDLRRWKPCTASPGTPGGTPCTPTS